MEACREGRCCELSVSHGFWTVSPKCIDTVVTVFPGGAGIQRGLWRHLKEVSSLLSAPSDSTQGLDLTPARVGAETVCTPLSQPGGAQPAGSRPTLWPA